LCPMLLSAQAYQRISIPVFHDQEKLDFPFVGGWNCPQFNQLDLDRDGDGDLVVFDRSNAQLATFLWDDEKWVYSPSYEAYFPEIIEWILLKDYNQDGYMDIFTAPLSSTNASIRVFKGGWRNGHVHFEALSFPYGQGDVISFQFLNLYYGVYVARTDIPAIVDVDKDGDLDVLSFESGGGTINYYQNLSRESGLSLDSFKMELADRCWGKFRESILDESIILSDNPEECAESSGLRHAGSTMSLEDLDGDGDLDVILGDADYPSLIKIENGDAFNAFGISVERGFPETDIPVDLNWFNSTFFLDIDQDGDREMIVSPNVELGSDNVRNVWLYEDADPSAVFDAKWQSDEFMLEHMIDWGSEVFPSWIDVNQDGLIDLIVGVSAMKSSGNFESKLLYYKNTGSPSEPQLTLWNDDYLELKETGYSFLASTFGDLNGDQVPDLLLGNAEGKLIYFANLAAQGEAFFFDQGQVDFMGIDVGYKALPAIFDVDRDGLNDLLIGNELSYSLAGKIGSLALFTNSGTATSPKFEADWDHSDNEIPWSDIAVHENNFNRYSLLRPYFATVDDEVYLIFGSIRGKLELYALDLTGQAIKLDSDLETLDFGDFSAPAIFDINADGNFELIVGMGSGGFQLYETDLTSHTEDFQAHSTAADLFSLLPNPARDWIQIEMKNAGINPHPIHFQLFDVYGNEYLSREIQQWKWRISMKQLPVGHYYLKITCADRVETEVLIKE
jgi:hypothetical protein